jgi:hypothetical protein
LKLAALTYENTQLSEKFLKAEADLKSGEINHIHKEKSYLELPNGVGKY